MGLTKNNTGFEGRNTFSVPQLSELFTESKVPYEFMVT